MISSKQASKQTNTHTNPNRSPTPISKRGVEQIERVKELYRELELEDVYAKYEEETHSQIKELIAKVDNIPHAVSFS